jgi:hypothetical protein
LYHRIPSQRYQGLGVRDPAGHDETGVISELPGSEDRLLEAQVNHHNLDYSTAGDENWYLTELLVTHSCVSLAVPSNFTNCPSFVSHHRASLPLLSYI